VVVRNNRAERNVAGIEVENTIGADVYGNLVRENTGGILVFNMPDLPQPGHSTRVYQNRIEDNNTPNFGAEGTPVASVPAGSGVVINSNDRVEIFDNFISRNETANVIVSSYFATGYQGTREMAPGYDPWPETIFIHGNRFDGGGSSPDGLKLQALRLAVAGLGGRLPDVLWDGYANPAKLDGEGRLLPEFAICLDNDPAQVLNADLPNDSARLVTGDRQHRCQHAPLPAVDLLPLPG
jgi:parallel beta-helix repeat protein